MEVLEHERDRAAFGHPLEERPPGGEEVVSLEDDPFDEPEQVLEPGLDPFPLGRVGHEVGDRVPQLREGARLVLVLCDPCAHPHHLGQRPEGDPVAVGEAAAAMPEHTSARPSTYFSNSHANRDLPIPATPMTFTRLRTPVRGRHVEHLLE